MIPSQKFGVEMPHSANRFAAQSHAVPFFTAETIPEGIPISRAIRIAIEASWSVTGSFCMIRSSTGTFIRSNSPKSPDNTPLTHQAYCTGIG